jgi:hypothetical protein
LSSSPRKKRRGELEEGKRRAHNDREEMCGNKRGKGHTVRI